MSKQPAELPDTSSGWINGDTWLTAIELAGWFGLTKDWVYDMVQAGEIPHHKFGRKVRFRYSEIDKWLAER